MKKNIVVVVVLIILVVISFVQAIQLNGLKTKVSELGTTGISSQKTSVTSSGGSSSGGIPSNMQNLPQMVGGC